MTDEMLSKRLGEPIELATQAAEQSRRATWVGRHPLVVFALLPVPIALLTLLLFQILLGFAVSGVVQLMNSEFDNAARSIVVMTLYAFSWAMRYLPFVLLAVVFTRLYTRHHVNKWWIRIAAVQVLVLAGSLISEMQHSEEFGQSVWVLQLMFVPLPTNEGWRFPSLAFLGWSQLTQILVPVAVGGFMLWATRRRDAVWAAC